MKETLSDPRVRKTRRSLQQAFIRLILRQGYDSISIQDIAEEAETARVTFYRHYADKEALLTDCLNDLYEDLAAQTERVSREGLLAGKSPVRVLYDHILVHESLYRVLFSSRGTQIVIDRMRQHLAQHAMTAIRDYTADENLHAPLDIIAFHIAGAQIGLAMWWLDHGKPYPAEYMAQVSVWLSLNGLVRAIGLETIPLPAPQMPR